MTTNLMQTTSLTMRNDIQGMRALAVIAVIIFHMNNQWLPGGFLGVDIFFVISGYIITRLLQAQQDSQTFSFKRFYISRAKRIIPAYLALIACCSLAFGILLTKGDFHDFFDSARSALIFNSNQYFADYYDYFGPKAFELPLLHTWSLAIEMQYYLLMPVLFLLLPKQWRAWALSALLVLLTLYVTHRSIQPDSSSLYYALIARIPEFLIGSICAVLPAAARPAQQKTAYIAGLTLVAASLALIDEKSFTPGLLTLPPCVGIALLIWAGLNQRNNPLCHPAAVAIGNLSYSLYLWHWPILAGLRYVHGEYALPPALLTAAALLTLIFGWLSYRFIESTTRKRSGPSLHWGWTTAIVIVAVGTVWAGRNVNKAVTPKVPVEFTRYADPKQICHGQIVDDCTRGDRNGNQEILIIGDSHAAQLNLFADVVGQYLHARMPVITASGCIPIDGFNVQAIPQSARQPCQEQTQRVAERLTTAKTVFIAGRWDLHLQDPSFSQALTSFFQQSALRQQDVFVLAQLPNLTEDIQRAIRFKALGLKPSMSVGDEWRLANIRINDLAGQYPNVQVLDFTALELWRDIPFHGTTPLYLDRNHLNETGARLYGEAVKDRVLQTLQGRASNTPVSRVSTSPSP